MNATHSMRCNPSQGSTYAGLRLSRRDHQTIADATFSSQQSIRRSWDLDFLAQMHHVDTQILRLFFGIGTPNLAQQLLLRHHFSSVDRQQLEERILSGGELDFASGDGDAMTVKVDDEVAGFKAGGLATAGNAPLDRP